MKNLFIAFEKAKPYKGKSLLSWLIVWVTMSDYDLTRANFGFLKTMTTWVVRNYSERRKDGVPMGSLLKFAWPETQKINLINALAAMLVATFRKRGLIEADSQCTDTFQKLVDAFDRAQKI